MSSESNIKIYKFDEVSKLNKNDEHCWLIIGGKVYDVTAFLLNHDHPGGDENLLSSRGKDATDDFEDVGHSDNAREIMNKYCMGVIDADSMPPRGHLAHSKPAPTSQQGKSPSSCLVKAMQFLLPLMVLGLALAVRVFVKQA